VAGVASLAVTTAASGPEFRYSDLLPTAGSNGADETPYRLVTTEGVSTVEVDGQTFLTVDPAAIERLTSEAMHDISHYLRPGHLSQLRRIIDDPEASGNDRFVALDLLKNVNISAGGVLPMCQDTGTAIVMGKKSERVLTGADDGEAISRGVYDAYTKLNLRYSQLAPLSTFEEKNTGTNLPAQIELYSTPATDVPEYKFLFMAKGGGSANKSFLFQETKAVLNPTRLMSFLDEKIRSLGTAACPPYHLAVVIGGTSAEHALETAKLASARYLDALPFAGSAAGHGFRDLEMEATVLYPPTQAADGIRLARLLARIACSSHGFQMESRSRTPTHQRFRDRTMEHSGFRTSKTNRSLSMLCPSIIAIPQIPASTIRWEFPLMLRLPSE
jgi:fumarate hydratase, class I